MRDRMPDETLGAFVRYQLEHMSVEELCGNITPLPLEHREGLAFIDDPTLERKPVRFIPWNRLPDRRKRER